MTAANLKTRGFELMTDIDKHGVSTLAAAIAFTTALAMSPFILILLSTAALLHQHVQNQLYDQLTAVLGDQAASSIHVIVERASQNPTASGFSGLIGFLILVISASAIFSQLRMSLDTVNERKVSVESTGVTGYLKQKFLSIGLFFGFIFISITSLVVSAMISVFFHGQAGFQWTVLNLIINFILFTGLFTAMFRLVPSDSFPWRRCAISGLCAAFFFIVGKALLGFYIRNSALGSAYGAAGSLIVFLVWVYYTAITLLVSYEFTNHVLLPEKQ